MMAALRLDDASLGNSGACLVAAAQLMAEGGRPALPAVLPSLTGIGDEVRRYLAGLQMAKDALADAARTGAQAVAELMKDGDVLDRSIAESAVTGFAGRGSKR